MSERERAMARFEKEKAKGLVDVKFFVLNGESLSEEEIFAAMNRIDDALEGGKCEKHETWNKDMKPEPFGPLLAD